MDYKSQLEQTLTAKIRELQPDVATVSVSKDGNFAIFNVQSRYTLRKLTPAAKEFLRTGDHERIREAALFV